MDKNKLETLVLDYGNHKEELDKYKKLCDNENKSIKKLMTDLDIKEFEADGYKVSVSVSKRETMDEDKLLEIAHSYNIDEIIKTKEYIDFDALEDAIYNGRISKHTLSEMNKAKNTKEITTLRVRRTNKED